MSTVKCGSHVRILHGRHKGALGAITSVNKDEAGLDYFVEYEGGMPGEWVRPASVEVFWTPEKKR